ncbi:restriction endonuclease [Acinetobacter pittii]|uniref:nSTAND3 domain-containing NTPase n=1 Tax=Acinetobacter pittii TaxID=48296 RepID=UPI0032B4A4DE
MADYDFHTLNDKDFEELVVDLLSAEFDKRIERFKVGKDGGVDGRFFNIDGGEQIIQCKHWIKTGVNALIKSLMTTEITKVKKLNPQNYFLVTSLPLSRENKIKIKSIFGDYINKDSQIFGREDLNDILKKHPKIERLHYKLWFSSVTVLESIINADIIGSSKYKINEINEKSTKYVITDNHNEAIKILDKLGTIIISGLPGIGKTTLADQICRYYMANKFEFYYIEDTILDVDKVYKEDVCQIFYFDDFLGSNYLEVINNREDSKTASLIKRIEKDKTKRFVLTTRTNILNQGKRISTAFDVQNIDKNEFELIVGNLKDLDKAKILYNHIYFSELTEDFIDQIYIDERYKKIINHKNYNPRIISFITDFQRMKDISAENYWCYIESILKDPAQIWGNVFDRQIDELSKDLVALLVLNRNSLYENELHEIYGRLSISKNYGPIKRFEFVMKALTGSLVNRNIGYAGAYYNLFNPSIADFIILNYFSNHSYLLFLLEISNSIKAVGALIEISKSQEKFSYNIDLVLRDFLNIKIKQEIYDLKFWNFFSYIVINCSIHMNEIINIFRPLKEFLFTIDNSNVKSCELILWLVENEIVDFVEFNYLIDNNLIHIDPSDYYSLSNLSFVVKKLNLKEESNFCKILKNYIFEYLYDEISTMANDDNIFDGIYSRSDYSEEIIINYLSSILENDFFVEFDEDEINEILMRIDVDGAIEYNNENVIYHNEDNNNRYPIGKTTINRSYIDPIADLFDRG